MVTVSSEHIHCCFYLFCFLVSCGKLSWPLSAFECVLNSGPFLMVSYRIIDCLIESKAPKRTTGRADGVQCCVVRTSPDSPVAFAGWSLPTASCPTRASTTYEKRPCRQSDAEVLQGCCVSLAWQESRAFTALWYQTWWHPSGRYHGQRRRSCVLTANVDRDKLKRRINAFSCVHRNCRAMWTRTAQCRTVPLRMSSYRRRRQLVVLAALNGDDVGL